MKTFILLLGIIAGCFYQVQAQQAEWEFGIQAESGRDWYHREYYNWETLPGGYIPNFPSYRSVGTGFFAERVLNPNLSVLGQIGYVRKKMPVDVFAEASRTFGKWISKEMHHRGAIDIGMRWYINPKSQIKLFVDGKLGANMLIAAVQRVEGFGNVVTWDAFGYNRINPVASGSVGAKWGRLAISAEYRQDLSQVRRERSSSGISGKAVVGKVAVTIF
ncbi:hypothetical protein [Dyadobacter sp. CY323]|uniref:hypothetical protein n=1 Tax=Dyadobacter sp. CY323 TaxID=2907302 RepID=UPI001F356D66|nr:hypothetical protein [Dyadobacter sp. CY323]MCE6988286.1 hypothetical protein [Dyadobacter sp. CY323]